MNYFKQSLFKNILMTKIWLSGPPWGPRRARVKYSARMRPRALEDSPDHKFDCFEHFLF